VFGKAGFATGRPYGPRGQPGQPVASGGHEVAGPAAVRAAIVTDTSTPPRSYAMDKPLVLSEVAEGVAFLTLNHPERRNALSRAMLTALKEHLGRLAADRSVRVVVLRAAGPVFSSGHDLRELVGGAEQDYAGLFALCTEVMEAVRTLPQPVI